VTAPLVVGPLLAYRYWRVERDGGQPVLRSLYYATPWPAHGPLQASCETAPRGLAAWARLVLSRRGVRHAAPTRGCQCGIYGLTRLLSGETIEMPHPSQRGRLVASWPAAGVVLLWGRVIQHAHGYRAEYARPVKICAAPAPLRGRESRAVIEAVAHRYAIEFVADVAELTRR